VVVIRNFKLGYCQGHLFSKHKNHLLQDVAVSFTYIFKERQAVKSGCRGSSCC
jgi:hypothetical protein